MPVARVSRAIRPETLSELWLWPNLVKDLRATLLSGKPPLFPRLANRP